MKYDFWGTVEIGAWMLLSWLFAILMIPYLRARHVVDMTPTAAGIFIVAVILVGAVGMILFIRGWTKIPEWLKKTLGALGYLVLGVVVAQSVAGLMKGLMPAFVDRGIFIAGDVVLIAGVGSAMLMGVAVSQIRARKNLPVWVRVSNLCLVPVFAYAAASFSLKINVVVMLAVLAAVSLYDAIAVWKMKTMQEMAQGIGSAGIIPGIGIPVKEKKKGQKLLMDNVGIVGGGDVLFVGIAICVSLLGLPGIVAACACIGAAVTLIGLLFMADPKKIYPAMPFITGGYVLGALIGITIGILAGVVVMV